MAAGKLLTRVVSFLSSSSSPIPHLRRLSTAATCAGDLKPSPENSVSVLHFLRGRGLGGEVLAGFDPRLLDSKVGKDLPAKYDHLLARGFSVPEAAKVLRGTGLLHRVSLISLRERLDALRAIVSDDADLPRIINRSVWTISNSKIIQRMADNASKLRGWGVSDAKISSLLVSNPRLFQSKSHSLDDAADRAEAEFGVRRDSKKFVNAIYVLSGMNESMWQSKFRVFESFGWEWSGVIALFKKLELPYLRSRARSVLHHQAFGVAYIQSREETSPRFELVNALKSKNLLHKELSFYYHWSISEAKFMEKYVIKFMKEEPAICSAYIDTVASPSHTLSQAYDATHKGIF